MALTNKDTMADDMTADELPQMTDNNIVQSEGGSSPGRKGAATSRAEARAETGAAGVTGTPMSERKGRTAEAAVGSDVDMIAAHVDVEGGDVQGRHQRSLGALKPRSAEVYDYGMLKQDRTGSPKDESDGAPETASPMNERQKPGNVSPSSEGGEGCSRPDKSVSSPDVVGTIVTENRRRRGAGQDGDGEDEGATVYRSDIPEGAGGQNDHSDPDARMTDREDRGSDCEATHAAPGPQSAASTEKKRKRSAAEALDGGEERREKDTGASTSSRDENSEKENGSDGEANVRGPSERSPKAAPGDSGGGTVGAAQTTPVSPKTEAAGGGASKPRNRTPKPPPRKGDRQSRRVRELEEKEKEGVARVQNELEKQLCGIQSNNGPGGLFVAHEVSVEARKLSYDSFVPRKRRTLRRCPSSKVVLQTHLESLEAHIRFEVPATEKKADAHKAHGGGGKKAKAGAGAANSNNGAFGAAGSGSGTQKGAPTKRPRQATAKSADRLVVFEAVKRDPRRFKGFFDYQLLECQKYYDNQAAALHQVQKEELRKNGTSLFEKGCSQLLGSRFSIARDELPHLPANDPSLVLYHQVKARPGRKALLERFSREEAQLRDIQGGNLATVEWARTWYGYGNQDQHRRRNEQVHKDQQRASPSSEGQQQQRPDCTTPRAEGASGAVTVQPMADACVSVPEEQAKGVLAGATDIAGMVTMNTNAVEPMAVN